MIKVYTPEQRADLFVQAQMIDRLSSSDLFDRAAQQFVYKFQNLNHSRSGTIHIFAGSGENGAFALSIARHLYEEGYTVNPYLFYYRGQISGECIEQRDLYQRDGAPLNEVTGSLSLPEFWAGDCIIDGLFAGEFYSPLPPAYSSLVKNLNDSGLPIYSLDLPTGLINEPQEDGVRIAIRATHTMAFESPRLELIQPGNTSFVGQVHIFPLAIGESVHALIPSEHFLMTEEDLRSESRQYKDQDASTSSTLLIGGSEQALGSLALATEACLRSGVAELEVVTLQSLNSALQIAQPEAVVASSMGGSEIILPKHLAKYRAINIGLLASPSSLHRETFAQFLDQVDTPIICSDVAISYLAQTQELIGRIPKDSLLTCTPEQGRVLFGASLSEVDLLVEGRTFASRYGVYVFILSSSPALCTPSGHIYYTQLSHAPFYKRGMSAVFVGLLTGLIAQGYSILMSVLISSRIFSEATDLCYARSSGVSFLSRDVVAHLGEALRESAL